MAKRAIYSGTFDPITNGHIDIIKRALNVFDEVIIGVASSNTKKPMFTLEQRVQLIKSATKDLKGVDVKPFDTLLVKFAKQNNILSIVRGLRAVSDFEFELQMGYANNSLDDSIDTIYFMPSLQNAFVSSSIVRELIRFDGNYNHLIPTNIKEEIKQCI
ncbi:MAG TPA: pantetheine-phosphate adenylyltransferase [Arcobacter sp.]|nr:pantetheine-phosphate adenylyltransferase [Arcobacter sp.]